MIHLYITVLILHLVFFLAVFDIYFRSPLILGLNTVENNVETDVRRLVLLVGDGLRADTFYEYKNGTSNAPFLRDKILKGKAAWGVSHSRVPTESRPGHVALLAGIYEDPSAVFKGWKANPNPFDSILNRSRLAFAWGSPDIVSMFKGQDQSHIFIEYYTPEEQDFSRKVNTSHRLNTWVYDNVKLFFEKAKKNLTLNKMVRQNKVTFFLHFLGIDVAGHSAKPDSEEYILNVRGTDDIVMKIEKLFGEFFKDKGTSYIFTADHGMTSWGSHGAGSPTETETPFVAWGTGIEPTKCVYTQTPLEDFYSSRLPIKCRQDINQADAVVLMSILLGVPIPTNSVGKLPVNYLDASVGKKFKALKLNALQLLEQFNKRHQDVYNSLSSHFFMDYGLTIEMQNRELDLATILAGRHENVAVLKINEIIRLTMDGIRYYETYFQSYLLFLLVLSFGGLMACIFVELLDDELNDKSTNILNELFNKPLGQFFVGTLAITVIIFLTQSLPFHYLLYHVIPLSLCWYASQRAVKFKIDLSKIINISFIPTLLIYILGIEVLVFCFFQRSVLTFGMIGLSSWPLFNHNFRSIPKVYSTTWTVTCWLLAIFPLLPTVTTSGTRIELILVTGVFWFLFGMLILFGKLFKINMLDFERLLFQVGLVIPTAWNIYFISKSIQLGQGLPTLNQLISILILCVYLAMLGTGPVTVLGKFVGICFSLGVPFLLFCTAHEAMFPFVLSINLANWIILEYHLSVQMRLSFREHRAMDFLAVRSNDIRKAFFFIFYIIFSFFAIGNIDSINSFDTDWVRCFVTVFSPFIMMSLILIKTVIPFLLVSCAFRYVVVATGANTKNIFLITLFLCEMMGLHFLFMVTNQGSWLEIGKSLSHYVIIETMILFLIILYEAATYLTIRSKHCWMISRNTAKHVLPKWHVD